MRKLKSEMLQALNSGDRARGEKLRAEMCEEVARQLVQEIEIINASFYRAWQDWEAYEELKSKRLSRREINR